MAIEDMVDIALETGAVDNMDDPPQSGARVEGDGPTRAVDSIGKGFIEFAERGAASNLACALGVSQKHTRPDVELAHAVDCLKRVESFVGQKGLKLGTSTHEALAALAVVVSIAPINVISCAMLSR